MTIPTAADAINLTESIKKVRRNIILLSLASLTSTKIIVDLQTTGGSLTTSPFNHLPSKSVFTFWFSFLFIHHLESTLFILLGSLVALLLRSFFDFYLFEKHTKKTFQRPFQRAFSTLIDLEIGFAKIKRYKFRKSLLTSIIYTPPATQAHLDLRALLYITETYLHRVGTQNDCRKLHESIPSGEISYDKLPPETQKALDSFHLRFRHELRERKDDARIEFYHYSIEYLSCLFSPAIAILTLAYCTYALSTKLGSPALSLLPPMTFMPLL